MFNNHYGKSIITRLLGVLLAVALMLGTSFAEESEPEAFFARFEGMNWDFCSGAGGWYTDLQIHPDGTFTGEFHDSEMGECTEAYPDGTVYYCTFSGRLSLLAQLNENTWKLQVEELAQEEEEGKETLGDGFRYVSATPYGVTAGDEFLLYRPGTPVDAFTDEMKLWAHAWEDGSQPVTELETWFMYSERSDSGFVGFPPETGASLANPWEDVTAERLAELIGAPFNVPADAEQVIFRWYGAEQLAEMQFTRSGDEYCFRAQPVAPDMGVFADISGMYYSWENEMEVTIGWCSGIISQARSETAGQAQRCLWYDSAAGISYSLPVTGPDLDGLDLTAVAEDIFLPTVG